MYRKIVFALLLAAAMLIFSSSTADALGVTPGRSTVDFEPGLKTTSSFNIVNNEHKPFKAYVYIEGGIKEYISFDQQIIEFSETDNSKPFSYTLNLPQRLDPGDNWGKIVVMELPLEMDVPEGVTQIIATVAVIHQVRVKVPYPGKYLQLDLSVREAAPEESVNFFVKMYNLGQDDIAGAEANIEILGPTNEVIDNIETKSVPVKTMEREELVGTWKASPNPGLYHAVATVRYDGEVSKVEKTFYVGNMIIEVIEVSVKDFRLGGIAKFDITAESKWNQPIKDVYAHLVVNDIEENKVADFKSASQDFEAYERAHLYAYWDTEGVGEGEYMTDLALKYEDRETERQVRTKVGLESIRTEILGVSVGAVTAEEGIDQYPIIILVVVLIAINLSWFLYFRRRRS